MSSPQEKEAIRERRRSRVRTQLGPIIIFLVGILSQRTGIVKLSSLSNAQTTTTNNQHLLHIDQVAAGLEHTTREIGLGGGSLLSLGQATQGAGEGAQLLGASGRGEPLQSQRSRRAGGGVGGESAEREGRASLSETSLAQQRGSLPTTCRENHGAARAERDSIEGGKV